MPSNSVDEFSNPFSVDDLLELDEKDIPLWIAHHPLEIDIDLIATLKKWADSESALANLSRAEKASRYAILLANQLDDQPLASAMAHWARGNYAMYSQPNEAIQHYQYAIVGYAAINDTLSVGRLWANLVGVYAECGQFEQANTAYQNAHQYLSTCVEEHPRYLLRLEQNYGWNLHCQGHYEDAIKVYNRALVLANYHSYLDGIAVELRINRNLSLGMLGRVAEIEASYLQERSNAASKQQILTVARIDLNLGELLAYLGQPAAALRRFRQAQEVFTAQNNEMELGWVMQRQAFLLEQVGDRRAAIRYYLRAIEIATRNTIEPQVGELCLQLAHCWHQENEFARALHALARAESLWLRLNNSFWVTKTLLERISLAVTQGNLSIAQSLLRQRLPSEENPRLGAEFNYQVAEVLRLQIQSTVTDNNCVLQARQAYQDAQIAAKKQGSRWLERQALVGEAKLVLEDDPSHARLLFEMAIVLDDEVRQMLTIEELKACFHQQTNELFTELIRMDIAAGEDLGALKNIWRTKASAFLELRQRSLDNRVSKSHLQKIDLVRQQLAALRWALAQQSDKSMPDQQAEQSDPQIIDLEERLLELRRMAIEESKQLQPAIMTNPKQILANMDADLLLEYVCCGDDLVGICTTRTGECKAFILVDIETINDLRDELQLIFENVASRPTEQRLRLNQSWLEECRPLLHQAYQWLIEPLTEFAQQWGEIDHLLIAPCAPIFLLPFAALWDGHHFLIEQYQLEQIASGGQLALAASKHPNLTEPMIISATTGDMIAVREEAQRIATTLPKSKCYIDRPALAALNALEAPPRFLHIAAHTLHRDDAPIFSALQLTNEVLSVEQAFDLPLNGTELVTLSGCATGGGMESHSALLAFQPAFLIAGAQRVLTTLWPIADDATPYWMELFYQQVAGGSTIPFAMQQTQQTLLKNPAFCHPALWAAFTCTRQ